jgi:hypothetical protein
MTLRIQVRSIRSTARQLQQCGPPRAEAADHSDAVMAIHISISWRATPSIGSLASGGHDDRSLDQCEFLLVLDALAPG